MAVDNKLLGQFNLEGIPPSPRGMPQIEVTFDIDANGIVNVSAKDKASGKEQQIKIQASGGLSGEDIERMVKEAESNASDDKKRKELIEAKNAADSLVYSSEKSLKEYGDKIAEVDKLAIEKALEDVKEAIKSEQAEDIKAKTQVLMEASMKIGEMMYKSQEGSEGGATSGGESAESSTSGSNANTSGESQANEGKVVDADFEEIDDNKKNSA
jgi:molecular chaperone DnaK